MERVSSNVGLVLNSVLYVAMAEAMAEAPVGGPFTRLQATQPNMGSASMQTNISWHRIVSNASTKPCGFGMKFDAAMDQCVPVRMCVYPCRQICS